MGPELHLWKRFETRRFLIRLSSQCLQSWGLLQLQRGIPTDV